MERNPVRAGLVSFDKERQWGSVWRRIKGNGEQKKLIHPPPMTLPHDDQTWINTPEKEDEFLRIHRSVNKIYRMAKSDGLT